MSLHATTTLCRHLQPHLATRTIQPRHLRLLSSTTKGSGLRRIRNTTRPNNNASSPPPSASPLPNAATKSSSDPNPLKVDPHAIANEMIQGSSSARPSGSEAVASSLTTEQKMSNYAMAGGLLAFVSYVFYYSLASVGGVDNAKQVMFGGGNKEEGGEALATNAGFAEFLKEAKEGMEEEEARLMKEKKAQGEADKLVDLDRAEGSLSREEEREMARVAGFEEEEEEVEGVKMRPLWRRVVFFWRRE